MMMKAAPGWGGFQLGAGATNNVDPEPGRCRRTDGKKWRCARSVVPEKKYCERHMHRGRHRRKPGEAAQIMSSSSPSPRSPPSSAIPTGRTAAPSQAAGIQMHPSALAGAQAHMMKTTSAMAFNAAQHQLLTNSLSSVSATAGSMAPSSTPGSTQTLKNTQSAFPSHSTTSLRTNQDNRFSYLGINKANFCFRPEQLLSDFSESSRRLDSGKLSALPSNDHDQMGQWHSRHSKEPLFGLSSSTGNFLQQDCDPTEAGDEKRGEMMNLAEFNRLSQLFCEQEQQNNLLKNRTPPRQTLDDDFKDEHRPLRHFFDDWPRTDEAASTLSWQHEDDHPKPNPPNDSSTHLSISITTAPTPSDTATATPAKHLYPPLSLSTLKSNEDLPDNPPHMALGISNDHQKQSWFSTAADGSVGGPLGEVVQSSTNSVRSKDSPNKDQRENTHSSKDPTNTDSPTGILPKPSLGSFSDSSSNASSPGSVRTEHSLIQPKSITSGSNQHS